MTTTQSPRGWEQQQRARAFVARWAGETRERGESQTFWNELFAIYGIDRYRVAKFEEFARRGAKRGFIDLHWERRLLVEQKSTGEDLDRAMEQALDYVAGLEERRRPPVVIVCDFATFMVHHVASNVTETFLLNNLPIKLDRLGIIEDRHRRDYGSDVDVNLAAADLIRDFDIALKDNGYGDHDRRILLTRIVFCLFADDANVWPISLFEDFITQQTREDGSDLGAQLQRLFQLLDTPVSDRLGISDDMLEFTYVNGGIFHQPLRISTTNATMRETLLAACQFNWAKISPAIFGSMFQNVLGADERRNLGAHYTSSENILRLIRPLFLDALSAELAKAKTASALRAFIAKLSGLSFLDPACGCGNFLVVSYLEIRRLETTALARLRSVEQANAERLRTRSGLRTTRLSKAERQRAGLDQATLDVATFDSQIEVSQFFGIEIEEWPCRIAEVAMHIAAHIADMELVDTLQGEYYAHFPIRDVAKLHNANALSIDWSEVIRPEDCDYVFGNPPFVGGRQMSVQQVEELRVLWGTDYNWNLDYVTNWYAKVIDYYGAHTGRWAFVSTNSVCQGEAVPFLWRRILEAGWTARFAHRSFKWRTEARRNMAGVTVSIIGFDRDPDPSPRRLWEYNEDGSGTGRLSEVENINPYLADAEDAFVWTSDTPISALPQIMFGNMPRDDGNLIIEQGDVVTVQADPIAAKYLHPFVGARELLYNEPRWCLWLVEATPADMRRSPVLRARIEATRDFRLKSKAASTRKMAETPHLFAQRTQPDGPVVVIPSVVSELREFLTVGYFDGTVKTSNLVFCGTDPDGFAMAIVSSSMFMTWQRAIGGRLESRLRFSKTLTYNSFPLPDLSGAQRKRAITAAEGILAARDEWMPAQTLVDLYDPLVMPPSLRAAHARLDAVIDGFYDLEAPDAPSRRKRLFEVYREKLTEGQLI